MRQCLKVLCFPKFFSHSCFLYMLFKYIWKWFWSNHAICLQLVILIGYRVVLKRPNCVVLPTQRLVFLYIFSGPWSILLRPQKAVLQIQPLDRGGGRVQMRAWKWITANLIPLLEKQFRVHILMVYYLHKRKTWLIVEHNIWR